MDGTRTPQDIFQELIQHQEELNSHFLPEAPSNKRTIKVVSREGVSAFVDALIPGIGFLATLLEERRAQSRDRALRQKYPLAFFRNDFRRIVSAQHATGV
jgi:hypothetical protein